MNRVRRFLLRIRALSSKEILHISRDPRSLYLGLAMPVMLLVLMGGGVSFDVDRIPLAVVDLDRTTASRTMIRHFVADDTFRVAESVDGTDAAEALFRAGQATVALVIPDGMGRDLDRGKPVSVQLLVDGVDGNTANISLGKADVLMLGQALSIAGPESMKRAPRIAARTWTRFNPGGKSALFLVPGLCAYVLALGAVLLTALTIAREWERGSMEQLFATPVGRLEIILGKLLPYLAMGAVQFLTVLVAGTWAFGVPIRGSFVLLSLSAFVFLVAMLGQGLLISVIAKNQLVATQMAMMLTMLPTMMLSGFLLPIENMPLLIRALSEVLPARHMVTLLRGILLKGNGVVELWPDLLAMTLYAIAMIVFSTRRFQRRLA